MSTGRLLLVTVCAMLSFSAAQGQNFIEGRAAIERQANDAFGERVSLDQAVAMAERRYRARAVRAETVHQGDRAVHKIRLLSPEGKVWNVRVDAQTGAMD